MKEKILLNFAMFFSVIGLLIIFLISNNIQANNTQITKLPDERIQINGTIVKIEQNNNETYLIVSKVYKLKIINENIEMIKKMQQGQEINIIARKINDTLVAEKVLN